MEKSDELANYFGNIEKYGLDYYQRSEIIKMWYEPHRFYHNIDHLLDILRRITSDYHAGYITLEDVDFLTTVAFVHDAVYDPRAKDNEERSAQLYANKMNNVSGFPQSKIDRVVKAVLATKNHAAGSDDPLIERFLRYDLANLLSSDITEMIDVEERIFKEYGFVDYKDYRIGRYAVMLGMRDFIKKMAPQSAIDQYLQYIKNKKRRIAVFAGSFNPFHNGHLNILQKAETMFDKVIVAFGSNPNKTYPDRGAYIEKFRMSSGMSHRQVEQYNCLLSTYVKTKIDECTSVTVVKGVGRPGDLDDEKVQQRFLEDHYRDIKIAYIIPDRKYDHLSSSGIRLLSGFEDGDPSQYTVS